MCVCVCVCVCYGDGVMVVLVLLGGGGGVICKIKPSILYPLRRQDITEQRNMEETWHKHIFVTAITESYSGITLSIVVNMLRSKR